ncbi:Pin2p ASCRUDRAFT_72380 [Ascoidea rubescens DSM 1968]|uniref:Uncharacterized protein n=1 Tax=Ascoidea rubescens DSM 1968 TaxID=1344418 RepID=A0A1D2VAL4_9ASCO|nr:hypothetical protein ASCRUDRAFT_72380 [Ascoidea rubescens DSM 1968]ODV58704.1 hypothetical protein ASCRUDRAFT_72380 [Ascoidea rubescens DSM 1968]
MIIPSEFLSSKEILCPNRLLLLARDVADAVDGVEDAYNDTVSTAKSFQSWDTCMDNNVCKWVAIVGIILASLLVIWLLSTLIQVICCGATCIGALCCCFFKCCSCCCPSKSKNRDVSDGNQQFSNFFNKQKVAKFSPLANPNMYPPKQETPNYYEQLNGDSQNAPQDLNDPYDKNSFNNYPNNAYEKIEMASFPNQPGAQYQNQHQNQGHTHF